MRRFDRNTRFGAPPDSPLLGVTLLVVVSFVAHLGLVVTVSYPSRRFLVALIVLLPSILWMGVFATWQRLLTETGTRGGAGGG